MSNQQPVYQQQPTYQQQPPMQQVPNQQPQGQMVPNQQNPGYANPQMQQPPGQQVGGAAQYLVVNNPQQPQQQQQPQEEPKDSKMGMILFLVGWIIWPCWWVGSCLEVRTPKGRNWRTGNIVMTVLSILVIAILILIYGILMNTIWAGQGSPPAVAPAAGGGAPPAGGITVNAPSPSVNIRP